MNIMMVMMMRGSRCQRNMILMPVGLILQRAQPNITRIKIRAMEQGMVATVVTVVMGAMVGMVGMAVTVVMVVMGVMAAPISVRELQRRSLRKNVSKYVQ